MSVENWKAVFDVAGVVAVFLALIAGGGVLWTGNIINDRQSAQLRAFDKALTDSKIHLEQERIRRLELEAIVAPRNIRLTKGVVDRLKRDSGTVLHIEYRPGEREPHRLAERIAEVARWAEWKVVVAPSEDSEFKPPFGELREGLDINGGGKGFPEDGAFTNLPKYKAAEQLWRLLGANDIDATLHIDVGFLEPGKPIIVKIWPKPLPYSERVKMGSAWGIVSPNTKLPQQLKERNDAEEKKRVEGNEHLRKEWYPDGQQ